MKKYFLKKDKTPVEFGDTIELDLVKTNEEGKKTMKTIKCQFLPELLPLLLEGDIVEEKEVDYPEEEVDLDCFMEQVSCYMHDVNSAFRDLNERINRLEMRCEEAPRHHHIYGSQLRKIFPKVVEVHAFTL